MPSRTARFSSRYLVGRWVGSLPQGLANLADPCGAPPWVPFLCQRPGRCCYRNDFSTQTEQSVCYIGSEWDANLWPAPKVARNSLSAEPSIAAELAARCHTNGQCASASLLNRAVLASKTSYSYSGASRYSYSYSNRGTNDRTSLGPRSSRCLPPLDPIRRVVV